MSEILIFNKWSSAGIQVADPGLERYITITPVMVPKTGARYAGQKFYKSKITIVERLINRMMIPGHRAKKHKISSGHTTGKSSTAYNLVFQTLAIVERKTKKNPIEVLVKAVENAAPREEIITIEYGGARYPKAVESSPQRRIDQVLKLFAQSTYQKTFNSKKGAASALADEIVAAYQASPNSVAISKKLELERQADASR
jgi:small subunit ribosomal protein S7